MVKILGISAYYHDSAVCLLIDGKIVAAAQEERFTRIKHDENFPTNAINFVLENSNLTLEQIDEVVFYEKPFIKFERIPKQKEPVAVCGTHLQYRVPKNIDHVTFKAGEALFKANCKACHTVDKKLVGPALAKVSDRREKKWLINFIQNPTEMYEGGDELTVALVEEYGTIMSSFEKLDSTHIEQILYYLDYSY